MRVHIMVKNLEFESFTDSNLRVCYTTTNIYILPFANSWRNFSI